MYTPLHLNQLGSSESSYDHRYLYIADKQLDLRHHDMVLEIGCNWGSFSSFMVKRYGCSVLALTSSDCQAKYAKNQVSVNDLQELISVQAIESLSSFYIPPCDSMDYELLPHEQSSQYAKFSKIVCTDFTLTFLGYPNFSRFVKNLSHYCFSSAHTEPEQFSHSISTGTLMVLEVTTTNYSNRRGSSASPASSPYARTRPSSPPNQTKHFLSTDFLEPFFYYEHFSSVFPTLDISLPMLATLEYYIKTLASHKFIVRSVNNITKDYSRGYYEWYMNFRKNRDWVERVYGESVYKNWELWLAWTASITERKKVERWSIVAEFNG
ncbi:S-adenosyl-L-methionine-dependent methyltransferase [Paraphysoderma sedebokerense]|nr:S-adenosyl-L-methionine-dependent methyltransferase [Paraphysoderma sedebokerense]KAI9145116.1 S-adenosyl-L-methionine-dependent methyltransferase [Paraphysoderma sedebokerense]